MELVDRRRARALASERRAGSWMRRRAAEEQYRFLRENPRVLVIFATVYVVMLPLLWLQPTWLRGFFLGAWTATIVWLTVLTTWRLSGVGHLQQGELAEQWTVQQLKPLTKAGDWRLINHVLFRPWDIDHVLIGPAGIVVIETKGGNSDWADPRHEPRIRDAVRQVVSNAADTRRFLRPDINDAPVHAVVALWPARAATPTRQFGEVTVLSGHRLCTWVESLPTRRLEPAAVTAAWQRVAKHLERRDAHDLERHGRPPRTLTQLTLDFIQYPAGVLIGGSLLTVIVRELGFPLDLIASFGTAALSVIGARRYPRVRHLLGGFALGIALLLIGVAVAVAVDRFS